MLQITQEIAVIAGDLTMHTVADLLAPGKKYIAEARRAHFDLQSVANCDSAGVAMLVCWWRQAKTLQKEIIFSHLPAQANALLRVCMLDTLLPLTAKNENIAA